MEFPDEASKNEYAWLHYQTTHPIEGIKAEYKGLARGGARDVVGVSRMIGKHLPTGLANVASQFPGAQALTRFADAPPKPGYEQYATTAGQIIPTVTPLGVEAGAGMLATKAPAAVQTLARIVGAGGEGALGGTLASGDKGDQSDAEVGASAAAAIKAAGPAGRIISKISPNALGHLINVFGAATAARMLEPLGIPIHWLTGWGGAVVAAERRKFGQRAASKLEGAVQRRAAEKLRAQIPAEQQGRVRGIKPAPGFRPLGQEAQEKVNRIPGAAVGTAAGVAKEELAPDEETQNQDQAR
jgi:hypothetical protein